MLLPGCPCCGPSCSECRHYNYDTIYNTTAVSVTINGSSVPVWSDVSIPGGTWLNLSAPSIVQSLCFQATDSPKRVQFRAVFIPNSSATQNVSGGFEDIDVGGCASLRVSIVIYAQLYNTTVSYNSSLRLTAYYDVPANCTDTGGQGTLESSWTQVEAIYLSEDCLIEYYDFLNQLDISVAFSWDPCECPP
jgi:hypothetical protein